MESREYHDTKYNELTRDLVRKAVDIFNAELSIDDIIMMRDAYAVHGSEWIYSAAFEEYGGHHGYGRIIRNMLRHGGFKDEMVPDNNLDDYYVPLLEAFVGLRPIPSANV